MRTTHIAVMIALVGCSALEVSAVGNRDSVQATTKSVGWFTRTFSHFSWETAVAATTSPASISWQVRRHVTYRVKANESFENGRETWERGAGDCKAFAFCVADLCKAKDIVCWVSMVRPKGESRGHAVAMGLWKGKLWMSSNGIYDEFKSLQDALHSLARIEGFGGKSLEYIPLSLM